MNPGGGDDGGKSASRPGSSGGWLCVACGSTLGLGGPDGGCLNCLARFALSPEPDEFDEAADDGLVRSFGHFEIVSGTDGWPVRLGRGAMGITYRARDTVLHTEVALKIIGMNVAGHPAARAAFLREARAAAKLRHANVASVFHYGEQEGECFYAMELVEGETLEARVRRAGPLPSALVLEVGRQVACALMEAEALGIVHRDLKPSNIMFATRRGDGANDPPHLKVIDFGLAQAVDLTEADDNGKPATSGFVGTPSFASPEQFASRPDEVVDTRSDIYSLGVTMWYLLCAKLPFGDRSVAEVYRRQTTEPLPVESLRSLDVPEPMIRLLASMLAATPASRPRSARALLDAMSDCGTRLAAAPLAARRRRQVRRVGAVILAVFGIIGGWAVWQHTRPLPPPPDRSLAVLPFENRSPDPANAFFATGVQDQITADLSRVGDLKVIGPGSVKPYLPGKDRDLATIGRELGVRHLLTGSLERRGDRVRVAVTMTDVQDLSHPWCRQYDLRLPEVFAVQGAITRAVAERLQASLSPAEKVVINRPPTSSPHAYDLYLKGNQDGGEPLDSEAAVRKDALRKIALLDQAVALDPDFALAYCALATNHETVYYYRTGATPEELSVDHRTLAEKNLDKARRLQPDLGEMHLAAAYHAYSSTRDLEQARHEVEAARGSLPHNAELELLAGRIARRQGRWQEAIRAMQLAADLEPHNTDATYLLCGTYHALRRYDDFERAAAQCLARSPQDPGFAVDRGRIALESRADLGPLRAAVAGSLARGETDNEEERLFLAFFEGDADAMERILAASKHSQFMLDGVPYPRAWHEALAARIRGDDAAARTAFADARVEMEKAVRLDPTNALDLRTLAIIDANLGQKEDAVREAVRACELTPFESEAMDAPTARCDLAMVYAWTGEPDLAFAELNKVVDLSYEGAGWPDRPTYGDFRLNPLWGPLRNDPRFESLVRRLAPRASP